MKKSKLLAIIFATLLLFVTVSCTHTHEYGAWVLTTVPTEATAGVAERECECKEKEVVDVAVLTDTSVWTVSITAEATCEVAGSKTYKSSYGEVVVSIPALEHDYSEWKMTTEPTELSGGKAERTCSVGNEKEVVDVAVLTNTSVWTVSQNVEATCEAAGSKTYTSVYGEITVTVPTKEHRYGSWIITTEPTISKDGKAERTCTECNHKEEVDVPELSDTKVWTVVTVEATCTVAGSSTYTSTYGEVVVVLPVIEHTYGSWTITTDPTESAQGKAERTCSECGHKEEVDVPVLSDNTVWETTSSTSATCTKTGSILYTSDDFGEVEVVIPMLAHTYGKWTITTEPTESTQGKAERTCSVCSDKEEVDVAVLTDTSVWTVVTVDATCTTAGSSTYTSTYGQVVIVLPVVEHKYGSWTITTNPTEENQGKAERTCTECNHKEEVDVPALNDATVWTKEPVTAPTYSQIGFDLYTSVYGDITVELPMVAIPYLNQTYTSFALDAYDDGFYRNGVVSIGSSWVTATLVVDENGQGIGTAYPFRGTSQFVIVDENTGHITMTTENNGTIDVFDGYLDPKTGIIVRVASQLYYSYSYVFVMTPFEVGVTSDKVSASAWDNAMAMSYTYDGTTYQMFTYNDRVYFDVTFEDGEGNEILPANCYNSPYLYVKDEDGNLIAGFVYDEEQLVPVDGYEGTYTNGEQTLFISGSLASTYNGIEGEYFLASEGQGFTAEVYCDNKYYEVVLDRTNYTFTIEQPMVTISFNAGTQASFDPETVNKKIEFTLPTPTHDDYVFRGWFYDAECTNKVARHFVPTESLTLYALWKQKVTINLDGVLAGDSTVGYIGDGESVEGFLPNYEIEEENGQLKRFTGWYWYSLEDQTYEAFPLEAPIPAAASGITIYATWEILPIYYGTYLGNELWGSTNGNNSSNTARLVIDENGNISGKFTGTVTAYDPATQLITWVNSSNQTKYLWFDEASGVIATHYSNQTEIGTDFYLFSKYQESYIFTGHYGLSAPKEPGSDTKGNYVRVIDLTTKTGETTIFVYNNHIYSNVSLKDLEGNTLNSLNVRDSKTIVAIDLTNNEFIICLASTGASFGAQSSTQVLDQYFGTYTNDDETVVLDGTGVITYGENVGKYTKTAEGTSYGFDVFFENDTENLYDDEYYRLTLSGESFTIEKIMVTITFVVGEQHTAVPAQQYNINVLGTLPDATEAGWVFNGWYYDAEFSQKVESFIPDAAQTLYAKHSVPVVLTINYNDNVTAPLNTTYSLNDVVELEVPTYAKHVFVGWFTTPTFDEGTAWTSGSAITADTTIYAKWEDAPVYSNYYVTTRITYTTTNGGVSNIDSRTSGILNVDPYGKAPSSSYPFYYSNGWEITDFDATTGALKISQAGGTGSYYGFVDLASGIIIVNASLTAADLNEVMLLNPFETVNMSGKILSSYWNSGKTRAIEYTYEGTKYTAFVMNNQVYFGVKFVDANGQTVSANACYQADSLSVLDKDNNLISKFAYDGTTMQPLDGTEGTYTNGESTLEVNGVNKVVYNTVEGTYAASTTATNTIEAYVGSEFFEFTLDVTNKTFTVNKPYVTVTFNAGTQATVVAQTVNKNIAITLPTPSNVDYVFRGWYITDPNQLLDSNYVPTADITLNAKWDLVVTLSFITGNECENTAVQYGAGDLITLPTYEVTNGLAFVGWFTDPELTTAFTATSITEDTTVYGKWMVPHALTGSYKGFEAWSSTSIGSRSFVIDNFGTVTSGPRGVGGTITDYNPETGYFKLVISTTSYYFGWYNAELGMLAFNYDSKEDTLGDDVYVFFKDASTIGDLYTRSLNSSGTIRLINGTIDSVATTILVYNDKVYLNVSYTTSPEEVLFTSLQTADTLTVKDDAGLVIVELEKSGNALIVKAE